MDRDDLKAVMVEWWSRCREREQAFIGPACEMGVFLNDVIGPVAEQMGLERPDARGDENTAYAVIGELEREGYLLRKRQEGVFDYYVATEPPACADLSRRAEAVFEGVDARFRDAFAEEHASFLREVEKRGMLRSGPGFGALANFHRQGLQQKVEAGLDELAKGLEGWPPEGLTACEESLRYTLYGFVNRWEKTAAARIQEDSRFGGPAGIEDGGGALRRIADEARHAIDRRLEVLALRPTVASGVDADGLTGLVRGEHAKDAFRTQVQAMSPDDRLSLVLLDIDNFGELNKVLGHPKGDAVLRVLGGLLATICPQAGTAFRWNGEEFALVLPGLSEPQAHAVAEGVRMAVQRQAFGVTRPDGQPWPVTVSGGVASCIGGEPGPETLMEQVSARCTAAKMAGRNRVVSSGEETKRVTESGSLLHVEIMGQPLFYRPPTGGTCVVVELKLTNFAGRPLTVDPIQLRARTPDQSDLSPATQGGMPRSLPDRKFETVVYGGDRWFDPQDPPRVEPADSKRGKVRFQWPGELEEDGTLLFRLTANPIGGTASSIEGVRPRGRA